MREYNQTTFNTGITPCNGVIYLLISVKKLDTRVHGGVFRHSPNNRKPKDAVITALAE